jgi:hypothetical protein
MKPFLETDETILGNQRNHPETGGAYVFWQQAAAKAPGGIT